jgi:XTP/dITP diphosphohydrolase
MEKPIVVIATGNPGKIKEFEAILGTEAFDFKTLKDVGFFADIDENGSTFAQNAEIKARALASFLATKNLNWPVLADDSGLEVAALHGEPGIFTARYAGAGASDKANYEKLLENLAEKHDRRARFVCWLCWMEPNKPDQPRHFEGHCSGRILLTPRGSHGFGYDPVFEPEGHHRSFGEMSHEEKKLLSHRGEAIKHLQAWLKNG